MCGFWTGAPRLPSVRPRGGSGLRATAGLSACRNAGPWLMTWTGAPGLEATRPFRNGTGSRARSASTAGKNSGPCDGLPVSGTNRMARHSPRLRGRAFAWTALVNGWNTGPGTGGPQPLRGIARQIVSNGMTR